MAKVSVIIPIYNAGRFLEQTLLSVQAQTFRDFECVLVDDGSNDDSATVAASFCIRDDRFRLFRKSNGGICSARNFGYAHSTSNTEYIIFTDHDDILMSTCITLLQAALDINRSASAGYGLAVMVDDLGQQIADDAYDNGQQQLWETVVNRWGRNLRRQVHGVCATFNVITTGAFIHPPGKVMVRRKALEAVLDPDLFDHEVMRAEDWDLWIRVARVGHFVAVPALVVEYRQHSQNASRVGNLGKIVNKVRIKAMRSKANTPHQSDILISQWRGIQRRVAIDRVRHIVFHLRRGRIWTLANLARFPTILLRYAIPPT